MSSSIADEITRLSGCRNDILSAISSKGVTVPPGAVLSSCPALINSIPTGGGYPASGTYSSNPFTAEISGVIKAGMEITATAGSKSGLGANGSYGFTGWVFDRTALPSGSETGKFLVSNSTNWASNWSAYAFPGDGYTDTTPMDAAWQAKGVKLGQSGSISNGFINISSLPATWADGTPITEDTVILCEICSPAGTAFPFGKEGNSKTGAASVSAMRYGATIDDIPASALFRYTGQCSGSYTFGNTPGVTVNIRTGSASNQYRTTNIYWPANTLPYVTTNSTGFYTGSMSAWDGTKWVHHCSAAHQMGSFSVYAFDPYTLSSYGTSTTAGPTRCQIIADYTVNHSSTGVVS